MPSKIWKSVMYGVFIGVTVSSIVMFVFRIIPISSLGMIIILYLYSVVGGVTGYIVHKKIESNPSESKVIVAQKISESKEKQELVDTVNYKQVLDKINNLKTTSLMIKGLIETRKKIEELKKESNSILEDTVEKLDSNSLDLTKNYLDTD